MTVIVMNHGKGLVEGVSVQRLRVNGSFEDLQGYLKMIRDKGNDIVKMDLSEVRKGKNEWTAFLQISSIEKTEKEENTIKKD